MTRRAEAFAVIVPLVVLLSVTTAAVPAAAQSVGACCLPGGTCSDRTSADCATSGGAYQGDGTTCATTNCDSGPALDQAPDQVFGHFSDPDCESCTNGKQAVAENFTVTTARTITQIVLWGGYYPGNIPNPSDSFTVNFHQDVLGLPGGYVSLESAVPSTRADTGVDLFGVDVYQFALSLTTPVQLAAGTYWVEIYNATPTTTDSFFWETGTLDVVHGIAGCAVEPYAVPGAAFLAHADDLAVQLLEGEIGLVFDDGFENGGVANWSSHAP